MFMPKLKFIRQQGGVLAVPKGQEHLAGKIGPERWLHRLPAPALKERGTVVFSAAGQKFIVKPRRESAFMHNPITLEQWSARVKRGMLGEMRTARKFRSITGVDVEQPAGVFASLYQ